MNQTERRYDIDWLRVIAIALLLIYHIALVFQPWGIIFGFIQSSETSEAIWIPMAIINIWRIPLLFFVSGMGVCFALKRRNWKQLIIDRAKRILLPLIFGSYVIVPIHIFILQSYYKQQLNYTPNMGHLWFLANIFIYVIICIGLAFLKKDYDYKMFNYLRKLKTPFWIYIFTIPFIIEAELINPQFFTIFFGSAHGFILGLLAFFFGFLFVAIGNSFWEAVARLRIINLMIAFVLYLVRLLEFDLQAPNFLTAFESICWIFTVLGYGYKYLNKPSKLLSYLSEAAYPIYIIHMIFLYLGAYIILPMKLGLELSLLFIIIFTFSGCYIFYELIIRRNTFIRPLFGLKVKPKLKLGIEEI